MQTRHIVFLIVSMKIIMNIKGEKKTDKKEFANGTQFFDHVQFFQNF